MILENINLHKTGESVKAHAFAKNKTLKLGISGNFSSSLDNYVYTINSFLFNQKNREKSILSKMAEIRFWKKDSSITINIDELKIGQGILNLYASSKNNDLKLNLNFSKINLYNLLEIKKILKYNISKKIYGFGQCNLHTQNGILIGDITLDLKTNDKKLSQIKSNFDKNFLECKIQHEGGVDNFIADMKLPFYYSVIDFKFHNSNEQIIDVEASIKGELEKILLFDDNLSIKGNCLGKIKISGDKSNPKIDSNIKIANGLFEKDGVIFPNINIDLFSCDLNKIKIRNATSTDNRGNKFTINGTGHVVIDGILPNLDCDLYIECTNYHIIDSDGLGVAITGKATGKGLINRLNIAGNVNSNISYNIDELSRKNNIQDFVKYYSNGKILNDNEKINSTVTLPFDFDINLNCKKLRVFGNTIDSIFSGEVKFLTFRNELALDGTLLLEKGYINIAGKNINIKSGKLAFEKYNKLTPLVNISASSIFKNLLVFINIKSKEDLNIAIDISSKPHYSPEQILAIIIFGRNMQDLKISEGLRIKEAIRNMKFKKGSKSILDILKNLTFLNIGIQQEINRSNRQETYAVNAGTYVTDKIYVGVKKNFEKENANVNIKLNISPQVFIEGTSGGDVGVSWIKRY